MNRSMTSLFAIAMLTGCASLPAVAPPAEKTYYRPATPITDDRPAPAQMTQTPIALPLPSRRMRLDPPARQTPKLNLSPAAAIQQGRTNALIEPSVDGYINAIQVYPYTEGALYRLYASPGQVSDIALQPGETLVSVSAGDTVRWVVGNTSSGSGAGARAHILVKPISAGLRTNLMIATDRRTYHLELESGESAYMAALSWRYPADELVSLIQNNRRAKAQAVSSIDTGLNLGALDFDYRITGDTPDWTPVRVFDDGRQVYIQMPDTIASTDMPPLFVLGARGEAELVNYRIRGNYYLVDQLFSAAELRLGTKKQTVVRIQKGQRRTGLAALFGR
jgi:type IV secretion system protein VirB9